MKSSWVKNELLNIPARERKGIIALVVLIVLLVLYDQYQRLVDSEKGFDFSGRQQEVEAWLNSEKEKENHNEQKQINRNRYNSFHKEDRNVRIDPFLFDVNRVDPDTLRLLGFPERAVKSLMSFRKKGWRINKVEDLKKTYGITPEFYAYISPWVQTGKTQEKFYPEIKKSNRPIIDLNTADTTLLESLPGIGMKLAKRIVQYRERLGGFHSVDQLAEVYGIKPETIEKIRPLLKIDAPPRIIALNSCTLKELLVLPYLNYRIANGIINYRAQHGPFQSTEDLMKTDLVDADLYSKIAPYLSVQ